MPNPCDSYHFGLGHVGEYFIYCPNRNVWGKHEKKQQRFGLSHSKQKRMGWIKHGREYMSGLLSKTYGGVVVRARTLWFVAVQTKTHGLLNIYRSG